MMKEDTEISKFLSYVLRHRPDAINLSLDNEGWAVISDLILYSATADYHLDDKTLTRIVNNSDKKRFTISDDGLRIRAAQGHSAKDVRINYKEQIPPQFLYHGTATRFVSSIRKEGLLPRSRQYVHLSLQEITASEVGQRHGTPVVLTIKALDMYDQGFTFFQADNGVWLTEYVPHEYIQE